MIWLRIKSKDKKDNDQDDELDRDDYPKVPLVGFFEEQLHFCVSIHHVGFRTIYLLVEMLDFLILDFNLRVEVLAHGLGFLHYASNACNLIILVINNLFLELENLSVVQLSSRLILTIISTLFLHSLPRLLLLQSNLSLVRSI